MSNKQNEFQKKKSATQPFGFWVAVGITLGNGIGVTLGKLLDNLAVGMGIGVALGMTLAGIIAQNQKRKNQS